jgi:NAD(P)H-dependent FMN reductase
MPNILVVTGSVRPNSVNQKVVPTVIEEVEKQGASATIADLGELALPFFNDEHSPLSPDFASSNDQVKTWTELVAQSDAVVFVTPEYNHMPSPVQANAIDWVGKEWADKRVGFVGYGWSGAEMAIAVAKGALGKELRANLIPVQTNLFFTKEIALDGSYLDEHVVRASIAGTIAELLK